MQCNMHMLCRVMSRNRDKKSKRGSYCGGMAGWFLPREGVPETSFCLCTYVYFGSMNSVSVAECLLVLTGVRRYATHSLGF